MRSLNLGCLALMLAPFAFGLVTFEAGLLRSFSLELYSTTYPSVMGTITTRGVETLQYTYEVEGRTFQGNNYQYSVRTSSDPAAWAGPEFRVGSPVRVFYRYGSPWESVLVKGVQGRTLLLLLGFTPVNLALFVGLFLAVRSMRKSRLGVRVFERNGRTHVRLTDKTPLLMGLAGAGAAALVLCIAVGAVMGLDAPVPAVVMAWGFAVAAGVVADRWWQARLDTGLHDLILDEQARTLSLPATHGRSTRRDVEWSAIKSVLLDKETRRSSKGSLSENFRCMLRINGAGRAELVREWQGDADRAANLVNWLQARLGLDESTLVAPRAPAPVAKKKKVRY
ncbi:DUF3592 domain-containing protein [Archangium gephyra]|uniref:DUF3592 domain-containing protein n=1 Tax=Archangium gephyra TaxID=48 RepID=UPI003B7B8FF9